MESFNSLISSEKLTLIDFYATWCGPCKMMHPVLEEVKREFRDHVNIYKIDVDKNASLSEGYHVQSVPTLMLFRNGELLWRQSGAVHLNELLSIIQQFQ